MNKLAVFDFDSTLMDGETIEIIASELNLQDKVAEITKRAMEGELDFFDSLTYRVSLLKGLQESKVDNICRNLPYMTGAKETISKLKNGTDHWMSSHFHDSFITTIILLVFVVVLLIITESIHSNQAFLFAACYLAGILLSVFCVGVFASLSAALMFVYFTFYKSKI